MSTPHSCVIARRSATISGDKSVGVPRSLRGHRVRQRARRYGAALVAMMTIVLAPSPRAVGAQPRVIVETNEDIVLTTVSPRFTIRSFGFEVGPSRSSQLRITLQVSENFGVQPPFLVDTTLLTTDTTRVVQIKRALPSGATVYWRALVEQGNQAAISGVTGPRVVPPWVTLLYPASSQGDIVDTRQPEFRWRSPRVDTGPGPWRYDLEVLSNGQPVFAASSVADTIYRLPTPLQANTSYRWRLFARLAGNPAVVSVFSPGSFVIIDPPLPTSTLVYQNFPNPFPDASSFSTCFWFDIEEPGGKISLEILDLRGTPVRTIVPAVDGQQVFPAGRYGRGGVGTGSNCDNRFVWDGTASNGRPVPPGVYLSRFQANGDRPIVRRILFRGR